MNLDFAQETIFLRLSRRRTVGLLVAASITAALQATGVTSAAAQTATPASGGCAGDPAGTPVAGSGADCVAVGLLDIHFSPNLVTIPADTPVSFVLRNDGAAPHDFSVTDHKNPGVANLGVSVDVAPGETKTVTVQAPAGTYYFFCDLPGHEQAGMFGYITAAAGAPIQAETATVTPPAGS